jgi:hypothetical protein
VKTFLTSILILFALIAGFSTVDGRIEYDYPFGNWAISGSSGEPVSGEGGRGNGNTFSFGTEEQEDSQPQPQTQDQTQETTEYCPITVEVVTQEEEQSENWCGVVIASVILSAECVGTVYCYVLLFEDMKRRNDLWHSRSH